MNEYIDEDIIPLKVGLYKNKKQSLDEGYYISGNFETFSKKYFFNEKILIYIPDTFIDMPRELIDIKYPSNDRPDIIKTNLDADVNLSISLLENEENIDAEVMGQDFVKLISKVYKGAKAEKLSHVDKPNFIKKHLFEFVIMGFDEKMYHILALANIGKEVLQLMFSCPESEKYEWSSAIEDCFTSIKYSRE
jgi:hypothetical protein